MQALLDVILPVFLVIGFGYFAVWKGWFPDTGVEGLMKFTQNYAIPCLLFRAISTLDLSAQFDPALLISFYTGATLGFTAGLLGARLIFKRSWSDAVAIGFVCLFSNSVLLGLPITERAYGVDALAANYAIVAVHAPFCYMLGVTAMEIARADTRNPATLVRKILRSMFRNALVIGIALGLAVNVSGLPLPGVFTDAVDMMVVAALPAALFGLGGVLVRYKPEGDSKTIAMVCVISLVLHPTITFTLATLYQLDRDALRSAVLTASMAPGVNTYIFANLYGSARRVAATSVLVGTAASIITVWLWLLLLP
ncbi:AEC family transporter [Boseongicola aestuarii]|uniref:Putative transporter YfdV n=1 Tax=Boseongicola aestuarii TaxID=1470561 RepID=A0A238J141_9RHOB|nr:AEC family transporter [Boseongicola aestuarii]SMX24021.1 putative transporter YfdV [Boseongicola aestuarii]